MMTSQLDELDWMVREASVRSFKYYMFHKGLHRPSSSSSQIAQFPGHAVQRRETADPRLDSDAGRGRCATHSAFSGKETGYRVRTETGISGIADIGRHDPGVYSHATAAQQLVAHRPVQRRLVKVGDGLWARSAVSA